MTLGCPENQMRLKLYGTHQLLVCTDDVNLLGDNMNSMKKNTEALIAASREVDVEVNTQKTKHMLMSHHENAGQKHNIKIANRAFGGS
jgi:hypothetical protein